MSELLKQQRDYAWSYFALHANQRMGSFNFFVVIAALLTTGLVGTLKSDFQQHVIGVPLGVGLSVIAFVFWKMDQRVQYLIKHAETALKAIEANWPADSGAPSVSLFRLEEEKTDSARKANPWPWQWHLSYANCFGAVYLIFGLLGLGGALAAIAASLSCP